MSERVEFRGQSWFVADAHYDEAPGDVGSHWHLTLTSPAGLLRDSGSGDPLTPLLERVRSEWPGGFRVDFMEPMPGLGGRQGEARYAVWFYKPSHERRVYEPTFADCLRAALAGTGGAE